ncbi:hypothetical protein GGR55DRAFT_677423 [Xylaria sp. FL0064]|nr:hypothetical protein GGR55DRAFT_677423 [Xylaria sp. FL0064]
MTKPWDLHEATIKKLYAEHTLAVVQKIMMEKYNFKASIRAFRGHLIKWGVRKYNCRRRSDCDSMSPGSPDGSTSGSDTASPTSSQAAVDTSSEFSGYSSGRHMRDNQPSVSNLLGQSYDTTNMETSGAYPASYGTNRALLSPTQEVQGWQSSPTTQSASPPTNYGHGNAAAGSGPLYTYQPLSPPQSTYSPLPYESEQANCDRRQSYPLVHARPYGASHGNSAYYPIRDYGHEHRSAGIGSFNGSCDQVGRHNSTG